MQTHAIERSRHRRIALCARGAAHLETIGDILAHRQMRPQGVALEHHAQIAPAGRHGETACGVGDQPIAEMDRAGIGLLESGDQIERRGLPAARGAEHGGQRTGLELHADAVDGDDAAECLANVLETNALHQPSLWRGIIAQKPQP